MKTRLDESHEFDSPAEVFARVAFLLLLASFAGGTLLLLAGLISQHWQLLLAGVVALMMSALTRHWLRRTGKLEAVEAAMEVKAETGGATGQSHVGGVVRLFHEGGA